MTPAYAAASARQYIQRIRAESRIAGANRLVADLRGMGVQATIQPFSATEFVDDSFRAIRASKGVERAWAGAEQETPTVAKAAQENTLRRTAITEASEAFNRRDRVVSVPAEDAALLDKVWDSQLEACPRCRERDGERVPYGTPFPGAQPGGMHPRCMCAWHVERRAVAVPRAVPAPASEPRLPTRHRPANDTTAHPPVPKVPAKAQAVPRGLTEQATKDFRRVLRGAPESALDFSREGYRPALSIYPAGLTRKAINEIATGRAAPPGSVNRLPPIHIAIHAPGNLADGRTLQLIDGRHRLEAAQAAGATHMRAQITVYGPRGGIKWRGERIIRTSRADLTNPHGRS